MKKLNEFYQRLNYTYLVVLLAAAVMLSMAALTTAIAAETPQLMFVQSADDLKVDAAKSTFRLVKVNQQTLYFSDRPQRIAGHLKMADYLKEWTTKAGKDNFGAIRRTPRSPSMSRDNLTVPLWWSSSPTRLRTRCRPCLHL